MNRLTNIELDGPDTNKILELIQLHLDELKRQRDNAVINRWSDVIDDINERIEKWRNFGQYLNHKIKEI